MTDRARSQRPEAGEYADYYAGYISRVPDGDIIAILEEQAAESQALLRELSPEQADHRYAPGKWSVKEVVGHLVDTEWIFTYRALRFARGDSTPLPAMDQDRFVANGNFGARSLPDLLTEWEHLRLANTRLFSSFTGETLSRNGTASERPFTVRALLFVIAGHERHHLRVLRERYLQGGA